MELLKRLVAAIQTEDEGRESTIQSLSLHELGHCGVDECLNSSTAETHSSLMIAAEFGYVSIVERLLDYPEIDVNTEDADCRTALVYTINENRQNVATHLINKDASMIKVNALSVSYFLLFLRLLFTFLVFRFSSKIFC